MSTKNMLLGNKIRSLRDEQGILQRQVAAYLEIDTPMFSKIERGDRRAKRSQVIQMATYFKVDEKEMLTLWLADKILNDLEGEDELRLTAIETAKSELMDVNRWIATNNSWFCNESLNHIQPLNNAHSVVVHWPVDDNRAGEVD